MEDKSPDDAVAPFENSPGEKANAHVSEAIMAELVKLRKKRKIGQEPIAKAIGITQSTVSQMENLKISASLDAVLLYARAIGANIIVVPPDPKKKNIT
jgi:predicted XRE-type DNA-binding protein